MYLDRRLWIFTEGLRWRIAGAVLIALVSAAVGIARLALLGWLLAKVFQGESAEALALPFALIAGVMVLRGGFEYWRSMLAHKTAALVQLEIRKRLYDKIIALGPAHFGLERTGDVIASAIDGVEQLETYFGQYLPQLIVAALLPLGIFGFVAMLDLPVAALLVAFALITLLAPAAFHAWDSAAAMARGHAYGAFAAEFLDSVQGLATLKAFGQSAARARLLATRAHEVFRSTMWVLATNSLSRGITDTGIAVGRRRDSGARRLPGDRGGHEPRGVVDRPDDGHRGIPAAARAAHAAARRHARPVGGGEDSGDPRRGTPDSGRCAGKRGGRRCAG